MVGLWNAGNWVRGPAIVLCAAVLALSAMPAHTQDQSLDGYWKQKGKSVYIKVDVSEGVYQAEIVRDDWSPGLVGSLYFNNVVSTGKPERWAGEAPIVGSDRTAKATLRITRDGELSVKIRRGSKLLWARSEAVEKRY